MHLNHDGDLDLTTRFAFANHHLKECLLKLSSISQMDILTTSESLMLVLSPLGTHV